MPLWRSPWPGRHRKSARKDDREIAKHISAFANASGGKLVIGIEDGGDVTGFRRNGARNIEDFERAPLATCSPSPIVRAERVSVTNSAGEDDIVLVLDIEASSSHVISRLSDGEVFLRQNDRSVRLTRGQVLALEYDKGQRAFEDELIEDSSIEDVDHEVLDRYKGVLGTDLPDEQVLRSRRFMRDGKLTVAGALLFASDPSAMMPQARVRASVFDDRLEIVSPGALPNIVTLDNMMTTRYSRNPRIARTLVEFGWVRELNEGVPRIYSEMQSMLLKDPTYSEPDGAKVQLTLENNIVARTVRRHEALEDRLTEGVVSALDEYELAAVRLAFTNGRVTAKELAERIGRSQRTATRVLKGIAGPEGLLEWHGSSINDPRQFYALR